MSILSTIFDVMSHIDGAMMKMEKWKMKKKNSAWDWETEKKRASE